MEAKPNVIFIGNAGVGKSFLCNALFESMNVTTRFKSGIALDRVTVDMRVGETEDFNVIDVPGLCDALEMLSSEANKNALHKGLGLDGSYYIIFVVTLEGGRIRASDIAMVRAVVSAFDAKSDQLAFLINKCTVEELHLYTESADAYRGFFERACGRPVIPGRVIALEKQATKDSLIEASLTLLVGMLDDMVPDRVENLRRVQLDKDLLAAAKKAEDDARAVLEAEQRRAATEKEAARQRELALQARLRAQAEQQRRARQQRRKHKGGCAIQ